ncbi:UDP-N-acetylmuramate--L-alanine ligase [Fonticella tunisiensis]|uniref:UDP-N-acetylmuramate--L-alanine ligase n=1 Tax=Fonticella tunisiensis TaxID=1096341 RepID=A0A4R7KTK9_9CLOT|nr:UDP-N-acetylmuramate--L-alanine ligase [Fonticella tunisiensis]TDT63448.1 UDP-N-acetylmuramate--L-alanine ligase [Fonticella tunisiensis]
MFNLHKDAGKRVHFIGIGGISMSGLAEILLIYGYKVSGSDRSESRITNKLKGMGAEVHIGHNAENVHGADIVVYTAAIREDNPEYQEAKRLNLPTYDRAEFLGYIMKEYSKSIAVAGTHGKTTTTSMLSLILLKAGLDPTILVGGEVDAIGGNARPGKSPYFITEACEYKGSFLKFYPYIGIILNVDADHLDYYRDIDDIYDTFLRFANLIPENGLLIGCAEDERAAKIMDEVNCNTISYGINKGNYTAGNIKYDSRGCASFTVLYNGKVFGDFALKVPGEHNILNALASIAAAHFLGVDKGIIASSLLEFVGTHRRFDKLGEKNGVTVIDDYAHHPTEIKATIKAAQNFSHTGKLYCVFQPHTYSRTITLFNEFTEAFYGVDKLILADIYAARERDNGIVNSSMLNDAIAAKGIDSIYIKSFEEIVDYLEENLKPGDLLITMGAGDVYRIGEMYLNKA